MHLLMLKFHPRNLSAFWDYERDQLLRRVKAAQRLQSRGRVCGRRVALDSGGVDFLSGFRCAAVGDEDFYYHHLPWLSGGPDFFVGV